MRKSLVITGTITAGVVALALAVPAVGATNDPASGTCTGTGPISSSTMARAGDGGGTQYRGGTTATSQQRTTVRRHATAQQRATTEQRATIGAPGNQGTRRGGGAAGTGQVASGTVTAAQRTDIAAMAEEEKMAHDVYVTLAARFPELTQFSRIASAETQHLTAVQTLMTRYGITDPTLGKSVGTFVSERMQALYDSLVAGATTPQAALAAGVTIEKADIADITTTMVGVTAQDVLNVYTHLRTGSEHHLAAFGG